MWICLKDAFFSIVEDYNDTKALRVRSRFSGDIEKVFGLDKGEVQYTPDNDYCYRVNLSKAVVAEALSEEVLGIDYPNFKNEADRLATSKSEQSRARAYHSVWSVMNEAGDAGIYKQPLALLPGVQYVTDDADALRYEQEEPFDHA